MNDIHSPNTVEFPAGQGMLTAYAAYAAMARYLGLVKI